MKKLDYKYCKAAPVMEWIANKWALATLLYIGQHGNGPCRFGDIYRHIPHLSEKVLADTLNYLLHENLLVRTRFPEKPPRVEYSLTPLARSFLREISYVIEWGQLHFDEIMQGRHANPECDGRKTPAGRSAANGSGNG